MSSSVSSSPDSGASVPRIDLADLDLYETGDPPSVWASLRQHGPVYWNESEGSNSFWAVLGYSEAMAVLKDPITYASSRGMRIGANSSSVSAASGKMLIVTDPPRHTALRRLVNAAFTRRTVSRLKETILKNTDDLVLAVLARGGSCEFVKEIGGAIPALTVCELLGVPRSDWTYVSDLTWAAFGEQASASLEGDRDKLAAQAEIFMYFADLIERKRRDPGEDIVSTLAHGSIDGEKLTDEEILLNCDGVLNGGVETTRQAATGGMLALAQSRDAWQLVRNNSSLRDQAVEEILRWSCPPLLVMRTACADATIGSVTIREGEAVAVANAAANRDASEFQDPDRFDIERQPNRHLTFGFGPHYCVGAVLARLELRLMLDVLAHRVADFEIAEAPRRLRSNFIWGFSTLPLQFSPAFTA